MAIQYSTKGWELARKRELLESARELAHHVRIDILDCSKSWARQPIDMSWADILARLTAGAHFTVILREPTGREPAYYEFGFSTLDSPSYFLWVHVSIEKAQRLLEDFALAPIR